MDTAVDRQPPTRVLVLRGGAIGDFVVTLPVLQWLRLAGPGAVIDLACHGRVAPLAGGLVSQWREIDSAVFLPLYRDGPIVEAAVTGFLGNYDLVVSFLGSDTLPADRLRELLGERASGLPSAICVDPVPRSDSQHATEFLFEQMRAAGLPAPDADEAAHIFPVVEVEEKARRQGRELLARLGLGPDRALIALHPGSGSPGKNAPATVLAEVCRWLPEVFEDAALVLIEGEADEAPLASLLERLDPPPPVVRTPDLAVLAGVLGECALFIGHDSGVSHIAAAVGVPTVAIFVSTDPRVWAPRGPRVALAESSLKSIQSAVLALAQR